MDEFKRRIYPGIRPILHDLRAILARRTLIRSALRSDHLDAAFRERLTLVVTGINGCRYCSYVHARLALQVGIPLQQIEALGAATFDDSPSDEVPALLYAQHWAETQSWFPGLAIADKPSSAARRDLIRQTAAPA